MGLDNTPLVSPEQYLTMLESDGVTCCCSKTMAKRMQEGCQDAPTHNGAELAGFPERMKTELPEPAIQTADLGLKQEGTAPPEGSPDDLVIS